MAERSQDASSSSRGAEPAAGTRNGAEQAASSAREAGAQSVRQVQEVTRQINGQVTGKSDTHVAIDVGSKVAVVVPRDKLAGDVSVGDRVSVTPSDKTNERASVEVNPIRGQAAERATAGVER